jgi:hypothetical protein
MAYASQMPVQRGNPLYKVATIRGGLEDHAEDTATGGAGSQAAGHLICNQTPAYIRGSGPLA